MTPPSSSPPSKTRSNQSSSGRPVRLLLATLFYLTIVHCHAGDRFELKPPSSGDGSIPESAFKRQTEDRNATMRDQELAMEDVLRVQKAEQAEDEEFWRILMTSIAGIFIVLLIFAAIRYFA
jgi:hypothetical protein